MTGSADIVDSNHIEMYIIIFGVVASLITDLVYVRSKVCPVLYNE